MNINRGWGLSISTLFWIQGLLPLFLVLPLMPFLREDPKPTETGVLERHTDELWQLVQKRAVWRPMIFVYLYNALMVTSFSFFFVDRFLYFVLLVLLLLLLILILFAAVCVSGR